MKTLDEGLKEPVVNDDLIDYIERNYNLDYIVSMGERRSSDFCLGYGKAVCDILGNLKAIRDNRYN